MFRGNRIYFVVHFFLCLSLLLLPPYPVPVHAENTPLAESAEDISAKELLPEDEDGQDQEEPEEEPSTADEQDGEEAEAEPDEDSELLLQELSAQEEVSNYHELKAALQNSITTHIILTSDIPMTGGIQINENKTSLVIDGRDSSGTIHTLTEYYSAAIEHTIYLDKTGSLKSITLCNINIKGKNHYGTVAVYDHITDVELIYDHIDYKGPQLTFNRNGKAVYRDSTISLGRYEGAADPQEVGEVSSVVFEGKVLIDQVQGQANEIFWVELRAGTIEVMPDAEVEVKAVNESGFLHNTKKVTMSVHERGSFSFTGGRRFWEALPLYSLDIKAGAKFEVVISGVLPNSLLRLDGDLTVEQGAEIYLINTAASAYPALAMYGGKAVFRNPKNAIFYSHAIRPVFYGVTATLDITAQQLNYWRNSGLGDFSHLPMYHWRKADGTAFTISGTVEAGVLGELFNVVTNYNLAEDHSAAELPDRSTLNLNTMRILAFGHLDIQAHSEMLTETSARVRGKTEPMGAVRISDVESLHHGIQIGDVIIAGQDGNFEGNVNYIASQMSELWATANKNYLYTTVKLQDIYELLTLEGEDIQFKTSKITLDTQVIPREQYAVTVTDRRGPGSRWKLMARQSGAFRSADEPESVIQGDLIFVDAAETEYLMAETDVVVSEGVSMPGEEITSVTWNEAQGILLKVPFGDIRAGSQYSAEIIWTLVDAP